MPELPEVEVSRMGISPYLLGKTIEKIIVRQPQLRWRVPDEIQLTQGLPIDAIHRRAKYLLMETTAGSIIVHLGMSGKLRVIDKNTPVQKHDHVDLVTTDGLALRYNDPRRFGAWLWQPVNEQHQVFSSLGPEPLTDDFNAERLIKMAKQRKMAVKNFIMDNKVVVGVGNIYANEALFKSGITPLRHACDISNNQYQQLTQHIKTVLASAIEQGGTTLKDFAQADGKPGYFAQKLMVYGRKGQQCFSCDSTIESVVIGQRNSFYCPTCQS
ncbi:bifunctional DNA-formamidopyrimidine glycosylase/DNA-(apurinic or apyrimidinic site) lyase [Neptunicella marina]|uniref:Formamidopyrimidine-DNA glycosylase n=1 Tax=Neptunicella marina TaxID=2125989 RepID=A0A8J6IUK1_9ALTE|nr:bifunctional DNA-formamidopyrimidine glycosylase/DNA-(apurinic or apyrimidinic site) lyase [Neptunicella marina]